MKHVLLLGDSIRINYQEAVKSALGEEYEVHYPADNCRFAAYTLHHLRHWLPTVPKPDVVHWNNGIWDIEHFYGEEHPFTPLEEYISYLQRIVRAIRYIYGQEQRIIFALTTPQRSENGRENYLLYNAAASEALQAMGCEINDLYQVIAADIDTYICEDGCHLSEAGITAAAQAVVKSISIGEVHCSTTQPAPCPTLNTIIR
ncbi:MAG: SGNH/GDSL hydrolase family protein [Clostridia bacterium]|nr:SGNH/GDSL hydrolase family protein [Clostridia bacterium]